MHPSAKSLILQLLSIADGASVPVGVLVEVGAVFDITGNSTRVTLARLLARGLIARDERGRYRLAEAGQAIRRHVAQWTHLESRVAPWGGGWVGACTSALPKVRKPAARRRARALDFLGFRALAPGLWLRPDNLGGVEAVRTRVQALGLDVAAPVFAAAELGPDEDRARGLWDRTEADAGYLQLVERLDAALARLDDLPQADAMVETFVLGGAVLHALAFDPLLPEELADSSARTALVSSMRTYERRGRLLWSRFMADRGAPMFDTLFAYADPLLPDDLGGVH